MGWRRRRVDVSEVVVTPDLIRGLLSCGAEVRQAPGQARGDAVSGRRAQLGREPINGIPPGVVF